MSSSPLYLAIVVVWLIVLVPMLLRKDSVDAVPEEPRREDEDTGTEAEAEVPEGEDEDYEEEAATAAEPAPLPAVRANERRSRVIARRRRRTTVLTLLTAGTAIAVAFGLGPWWVTIPPVLLLGGHLVLLREAAKADAEQRAAVLRARRRAALRARRLAERQEREAEREAEIIALRDRRSQVYDQYADARLRAAGD
ncbi:hypothetical protein ACOQFV_06995 [Nocardiopsis changdeensis]|uniref:Uncharacterized protein n=1 Tax=Nocardiopsis changdeensis TaxID=2831969 RepID=A0ABX8BMW0_9ACTN|nr:MULTISPECIES: hypothetical protein [Nocardiopsis]QUX23582.1 hypothetical protein KGD84_04225 [Nocardiopsis changdeensis]QYX39526.1 hypothetical protein K1J57_13680 [Nocardiopsis sp. MT53]